MHIRTRMRAHAPERESKGTSQSKIKYDTVQTAWSEAYEVARYTSHILNPDMERIDTVTEGKT